MCLLAGRGRCPLTLRSAVIRRRGTGAFESYGTLDPTHAHSRTCGTDRDHVTVFFFFSTHLASLMARLSRQRWPREMPKSSAQRARRRKNPTTPYNRAGRQDQRACVVQPEKQRKSTDAILLDMFCAVVWRVWLRPMGKYCCPRTAGLSKRS